jgi:hypothetical protein
MIFSIIAKIPNSWNIYTIEEFKWDKMVLHFIVLNVISGVLLKSYIQDI